MTSETYGGLPRIMGGVERSQAPGRYEIWVGTPGSGHAGVYGTPDEIREIIAAMQRDLEYCETWDAKVAIEQAEIRAHGPD